jgi:NADH:ubiquinone oxidoreductase subunit E
LAFFRRKLDLEKEKIDQIVSKYSEIKGNLIGILHDIQDYFRYLPEKELRYLSEKINVPATHIYSIANFFNRFSLTPKGEHELNVCLGTACHVSGGPQILNQAKKDLKIKEGETSEDKKITLGIVRCIGACSLAPAVMIDDQTYSNMTSDSVSDLVKSLKNEEN